MLLKHLKWALLWALLIFILCLIPGKDLPHHSIFDILSLDKLVHFTLFCILYILAERAVSNHDPSTGKYLIMIATICIAYGGLLELMQGMLLKDRKADAYDFIANTLGVTSAFLINYRKK